MREPTRPSREAISEAFADLAPDQIAKIALLAVQVSAELGRDNAYGAWEILDHATLEAEEKMTLWLLLDSQQRSAIKGISRG